ncbi:hypothetical protein TSUD_268630, partial [Trifolium subterraneum]
MSKTISTSLLISFLIFSHFVIEIHGNKQVKALDNLHKEKYRVNSQIDKSGFEVQDIVYEEAIVHSQEGLKEKDRIKRLPGQPFVKFSQFGGYVTLDKSAGSAFYYYFVEAQQSKETLPLLLWLNGGPGCSSLAYGAMQELGPFRIGNAVINDDTDSQGMYDFLASHAIISDHAANVINKNICDFSSDNLTNECNAVVDEVGLDLAFIDLYNIYAPVCKNENLTSKPNKYTDVNDPCGEFYVFGYLNREDVQKALHANVTKLKYEWSPCSSVIRHWLDSSSTVLPLLHEFLNNGLRVWIFSGDTDGRVPVTSTKNSIKKMNLPVKNIWHPWFSYGE